MKTLTSAPVTNRTLRSLGHELEVDEHSFGWLGAGQESHGFSQSVYFSGLCIV
jgi:hypothetical protein